MGIVMGSITAYYAKQKNKDPFIWFFVGFLFGMLGLLSLFIISNFQAKREAQNQPPPAPKPVAPAVPQKFWYYLDQENRQFGPVSFDALNSAWKEGKITVNTFVWNEDLDGWKPFEQFTSSP
jgi:hypothetical protein